MLAVPGEHAGAEAREVRGFRQAGEDASTARVRWLLLAAIVVCGCKSQPPATTSSRNPTRTEPLTEEEVESSIRGVAPDFGLCYQLERRQLFASDLSQYVLQIRVPNDGSSPEVSVVKASVAGQAALEQCVVRVMSRLRFPPHPGKRITLNVPIEEAR
jgi:hypothetical protein